MSIKKSVVIGSMVILGLGLFIGETFAQTANPAAGKQRQETGLQLRTQFIDEDGDGICDRSEDGTRPQDGTGNKYRRGAGQGQGRGNGWNRDSFRGGQGGFGTGLCTGTGICDGTGPKGQALRKGKR